jgi:hypothetical protein
MSTIINELLCALKCYFGKYPKMELLTVFAEFYSDCEISDAKTIIVEFAEKITPRIEELGSVKPRVGDGKTRRSMEDVLNVYGLLDQKKIKLPSILAADCCRIPSLKDLDIGKLSNRIDDIRSLLATEMCNLGTKFSSSLNDIHISNNRVLDELKVSVAMVTDNAVSSINSTTDDARSNMSSICSSAIAALSASSTELKLTMDKQSSDLSSVSSAVDGIMVATKQAETYAEKLINSANTMGPDVRPWYTMVSGKPRLLDLDTEKLGVTQVDSNRRKIIGCNSTGVTKLKSSRDSTASWHVFVGKLEPDTTDQDLKDHLLSNGITVFNIVKLKAVQKWQEKCAAFKISVADIHKCDIMKADLWPENVLVRDWVFKPRP